MSPQLKYQNLDSISTNVTGMINNGNILGGTTTGFDDTMILTPCTIGNDT